MKECKICGCGTNEETGICITCQSKQWLGVDNKDEDNKKRGQFQKGTNGTNK